MADTRWVWTRDGKIPLKPPWSGLGVTREERIIGQIDEYASHQHFSSMQAFHDVYVRAYRRAGLLPGDPDEALSACLPVETQVSAEGYQEAAEDSSTEPPEGETG
jgi:hypothetical protein